MEIETELGVSSKHKAINTAFILVMSNPEVKRIIYGFEKDIDETRRGN